MSVVTTDAYSKHQDRVTVTDGDGVRSQFPIADMASARTSLDDRRKQTVIMSARVSPKTRTRFGTLAEIFVVPVFVQFPLISLLAPGDGGRLLGYIWCAFLIFDLVLFVILRYWPQLCPRPSRASGAIAAFSFLIVALTTIAIHVLPVP